MKIISAIYTNPDNDAVAVTYDTGEVWHMTLPSATWRKEHLDAYLAGGGVIEPMPAEDEGDPDPVDVSLDVTFEQHLEISDSRLDALEERVLSLERQLEVHHG